MKLLRRLFVPDCHYPHADSRAFHVLCEVARDFKPHEVVILGDFWDVYCLSRFQKDPQKNLLLFKDERIAGQEALAKLERFAKANRYVFLAGNHEARIDKYINAYADKLSGILPTREILGLPKKYVYLPYGQGGFYKCGNLIVTHGTLTQKHAACAMIMKYGTSVLFGHTHKRQVFHTTNIYGQILQGINIGWLGNEKHAEYISDVAEWTQAFALGWFKKNGTFWIDVHDIINQETVIHGRLYKG